MKRSEMVTKARITIQMCTSGLSLDHCENIANNVLYQLEKAGMLPPNTNHSMLSDYQNYDPNFVLSQCKWDKEDETSKKQDGQRN